MPVCPTALLVRQFQRSGVADARCVMCFISGDVFIQLRFFLGTHHCAAAFHVQAPNLCTNLDSSFLYSLIPGICSRLIREKYMLALSVWHTYLCMRAGRRRTNYLPRTNYLCNTTQTLVYFYLNVIDERLWTLNSTEILSLFEQYPIQPESTASTGIVFWC